MIRIILIRHGRTAWNMGEDHARRFRGTIDLPLANEGVSQAQATARRLAELPLSAIYSSPLQRAARTAEIIAEPHALPVQTLPGLGSVDYGDWAGQVDVDVARRYPDLIKQWRADPFSLQIPGGESTAALRGRAATALREALTRHKAGETIAVVSHQIVTRTLICTLAGLPNAAYWRIRQDLCNLSLFDYDPSAGSLSDPTSSAFTLAGLNDTCHLNDALPGAAGKGARIILIRHGQTVWNVGAGEERFRGRTNLPLDGTGHAQARAVAERLGREPIAALYASPLLRTRQTIEPLANRLGLPVQANAGLLDIDYGYFQGLTHSEAAAAYPETCALWRTNPSQVRFPGGEGLVDVQARFLDFLGDLAARHQGETVALVGHQIVNKVAVCCVLGLDLDQIWRIQQDTCGIDLFQQSHHTWHAACVNDVCHL